MKRSALAAVLFGLWGLSCGGKGAAGPEEVTTGPEEVEVSQASYAVFGMIMYVGEEMAELGGNCAVVLSVHKGAGTEDVSSWPMVEPSKVKLLGQKELNLNRMPIPVPGNRMVYVPEGEVLPGESYRLQVEVEGRTFTSNGAATVLPQLHITTQDGQRIEPGSSFTVVWEEVKWAGAYAVTLSFPGGRDTTFVLGKATSFTIPGELMGEEGTYDVAVVAFEGKVAQYVEQWLRHNFVPIFDFDDPNVLGTFFSTSGDNLSIQVGTAEVPQPGGMEVTVSGGTTPIISWTGGNAKMLSVMDEEGDIMWAIVSMAPSGFAPPVTYGQAPPGTMQVSPPKPLVAGKTYQVVVQGLTGAFGTKTFTP